MKKIKIALGGCVVLVLVFAFLVSSGKYKLNNPSRNDFPVRGIDVSNHQGLINWSLVADSGIDFAYVKASEGRDFVDKRFVENWSALGKTKIKRGAYHFFTFKSSGVDQAKHFIATVPAGDSDLPPAIDVEFGGNSAQRPTPAKFKQDFEDCYRLVKDHFKTTPVVYTTYDFYDVYLSDVPLERIWIREVFRQPGLVGKNRWILWQFSDRESVNGIIGLVDMNVLRGDLELESLIGKSESTR